MNTESYPKLPDGSLDYQSFTQEQLIEFYDQIPTNSEEFESATNEMVRRGFVFKKPRPTSVASRYPAGGSAAWITVYSILGIGVFTLIMAGVSSISREVDARTTVIAVVIGLIFVSMGILMSGLRKLAYLKHKPDNAALDTGAVYTVFGIFWSLLTVAVVYFALYLFIKVVEWSPEYAIKTAILPLILAFIPGALSAAFFLIAREISSFD